MWRSGFNLKYGMECVWDEEPDHFSPTERANAQTETAFFLGLPDLQLLLYLLCTSSGHITRFTLLNGRIGQGVYSI